jgi:hypothetical protein
MRKLPPLLLRTLVLLVPLAAQAQTDPSALDEEDRQRQAEAFVLPDGAAATPPFVILGYIDVGFARAQGDGTSFAPGYPGDEPDYHTDPFAPAVNSRGDVAAIDAGGKPVSGFLPRTVNTGGRGSFLINTLDLDLRYQAPRAPVLTFARVQFLPRWGGDGRGNQTMLLVEQAFGRLTPFDGRELFVSLGKFDSVVGIEYLDNQANYRTGITPSLMARYTTGTALGAKAFYRQQLPAAWSAISVNAAVTNGSNFVEALHPPDASLTGVPSLSARLGFELNLPAFQIKLGASGLRGPRNDAHDVDALLQMYVLDARLLVGGLSLSAEYVKVDEEEGQGAKQTGMGAFPEAAEFHAQGAWAQAAYSFHLDLRSLRAITLYARLEQRHAWFEEQPAITVGRLTAGLRLDLWDCLLLKGEMLVNRELEGAPGVENDVLTFSGVYSW